MRREDQFQIQALLDGELNSQEEKKLWERLNKEDELRKELVDQMRLNGVVKESMPPMPSDEWFDKLQQNRIHKGFIGLGSTAVWIFGGFLMGWGVSALISSFVGVWPRVGIIGFCSGIGILSYTVVKERILEEKNDRYKGIIR